MGDSFSYAGAAVATFNIRNANDERAKIEASIDVNLWYGASAGLLYNRVAPAFASISNASTLFAFMSRELFLTVDLRKLYVALFFDWADISFGRQVINFGRGMMFSPIDAFSSVSPADLSFRRDGSDVLRVKVPFGDTAGLDMMTTLSSKMTNIKTAVKLFGNIFGWDLSALGMYNFNGYETTIGIDFKGDVEVGIYGEFVFRFTDYLAKRHVEAMLGADYSIEQKWFFRLEYYYNEDAVIASSLTPTALVSVQKTFFGKHYLFGSIMFKLDDLTDVSMIGILDLPELWGMYTLMFHYNLFQNTDITAYVRYYDRNINGLSAAQIAMFTGAEPLKLEYGLRAQVKF
ncbi:MAG: hypothetical protein AABZ39_00510 [Spirochaetota bacterium]